MATSSSSSSDSKAISALKLRRRHPGTTSRPSNLDIIDDAWASDKLSDDEIDTAYGEHAISLLLEAEDEGELDDGIVTAANSGSAASSALERRRREEGRWNDLGLDMFDGLGAGNNGMGGGLHGAWGVAGGMGSGESGTSTGSTAAATAAAAAAAGGGESAAGEHAEVGI